MTHCRRSLKTLGNRKHRGRKTFHRKPRRARSFRVESTQNRKTDLENSVRTVTNVADLAEHLVAVVLLALLAKALKAQLLLVLLQIELLRTFAAIVLRASDRLLRVDLVLVDRGQLVHQLLAALRAVLQKRAVVVDAAIRFPFPLHRPYHVDYGVHHVGRLQVAPLASVETSLNFRTLSL